MNWLTQRFTPLEPTANGNPPRDHALEGLRGIAAFLVLFSHWLPGFLHPDPNWDLPVFFGYFALGGPSVYIFFVLSGYVIGLSNKKDYSAPAAGRYFQRRVVRLLPINIVAVGLAVLTLHQIEWGTVLGSLLFLQNNLAPETIRVGVLITNPPLWSLNYEMVYYAAFIALWALRPPIVLAFGLACLLAFNTPFSSPILATFASGAIFWLAGLWLAWRCPASEGPKVSNWPSLILLGIAAYHMQFSKHLLGRFGLSHSYDIWVGIDVNSLELVPVCVCIVAALSNRSNQITRVLRTFVWLWPTLFFGWRISRSLLVFDELTSIYFGLYLLGICLWKLRISPRVFEKLAPLGAISYAVYALAYPIQAIIRQCLPEFSGTPTTFTLRVLFALAATVALAWCLELKLQPKIKAWLLD